MAFQNKNLSVIAYANGFTLWHYASASDAAAAITASGYFNSVKTLMNSGDIIIVNGTDATSIQILSVAADTVTCAPITK